MSHLAPAQPEPDEEETRGHVLSLQSSVVYGCVGNKASVFPLQLLGFEADPVHSCQFSNHTGYKVCTGSKMMGEELAKVVSGLKQNNFLSEYTDLLTGYMASASFLQETARLARSMRESNPNLFYVCDPVLGDDLRLYVPEEFVEIYRDEVVPLANVVTPNQTEAQYLTGQSITSLADAALACEWFHERGIPIVVITSITLDRPDVIHILASHRKGLARNADFERATPSSSSKEKENEKEEEKGKPESEAGHVYYHLSIPRVPRYYSGTGDLTAALLLAWLKRDRCLKTALEKSIASVQAVLARTQKFDRKEIMIVPSRHDIDQPRVSLFATPLSIEQLRARAKEAKEAEAAKSKSSKAGGPEAEAEAEAEAGAKGHVGHVHCVPDC